MEKTGCEITSGAPTTLAVTGEVKVKTQTGPVDADRLLAQWRQADRNLLRHIQIRSAPTKSLGNGKPGGETYRGPKEKRNLGSYE